MSVEMSNIGISKTENDVVYGSFILKKYKELRIEFKFKNGEISYYHAVGDMKKIDSFHEWLLKEKDIYTPFILNYLNEIERLNHMSFSKGEVVEEVSLNILNAKCYMLRIKYEELSRVLNLQLYPNSGDFYVLYKFPIPINSDGEYSTFIQLQHILKKETIQRMWEPFRSKTKYKLPLLNVLR